MTGGGCRPDSSLKPQRPAYSDDHPGTTNPSRSVRREVGVNLDTRKLPDGAVTETAGLSAACTSSHERLNRADPSLFHRENFHAARRHVFSVNGLLNVATVPGKHQVVQVQLEPSRAACTSSHNRGDSSLPVPAGAQSPQTPAWDPSRSGLGRLHCRCSGMTRTAASLRLRPAHPGG